MRPLTRREAARMGRLGGLKTGAARAGDSEWGQWMRRRRGGRTQKLCYPTFWPLWLENARRAKRGLPLLPIPEVPAELMRPTSVQQREARRLTKAQKEYDRLHNLERWRV